MTWTVKIRGVPSQPITQEFECPVHGRFEATAPHDTDAIACIICGVASPWVISAPHGSVNQFEVVRGGVAKAENPGWLSTRALAEGMPIGEWKAKREKFYAEKRHAEAKEFGRFVKGVS